MLLMQFKVLPSIKIKMAKIGTQSARKDFFSEKHVM